MEISVNGKKMFIGSPCCLDAILGNLGINNLTPSIAIAINGRIVFRRNWGQTPIVSGDQIEVIHAAQGG